VCYNIARFFAHESCGQCTPCREGTAWMLKILDRMRHGEGRKEDLEILADVGHRIGIIPGTTICGLSDGAGLADQECGEEVPSRVRVVYQERHQESAPGAVARASLNRRVAMRTILRLLVVSLLFVSISCSGKDKKGDDGDKKGDDSGKKETMAAKREALTRRISLSPQSSGADNQKIRKLSRRPSLSWRS